MSTTLDYTATKLRALTLLDEISPASLVPEYSAKYNAKSALFKHLGIPPERMAVMAPRVNDSLKAYPDSRKVTSAALVSCKSVGDFIKLYSGAARVTIPPGEPT